MSKNTVLVRTIGLKDTFARYNDQYWLCCWAWILGNYVWAFRSTLNDKRHVTHYWITLRPRSLVWVHRLSVVCIKIYLFLLPPRFIQKLPFSSHLRRLPSFLYNLFPPQRSASLIPNHTTSVRLSFNHPNQTSFHLSTPSVKQSPPLYENLSFVTCSPSHACSTADQASSSSTSGRLSVATRERDVCGGTSFVLVFALILSQIDDLHRSITKVREIQPQSHFLFFSHLTLTPI